MRKKIKITSDFNKRLERLFSSEKDILLDIISIIGSVDYDYLYQNRTFTTTPIILNKLTNKEEIPLLPVWQNENTINLFVNKFVKIFLCIHFLLLSCNFLRGKNFPSQIIIVCPPSISFFISNFFKKMKKTMKIHSFDDFL